MIKKKHFLLVLLTFATFCTTSVAQNLVEYDAIMRTTSYTTMWDGKKTLFYGFADSPMSEPTLPGFIIEAEEGDSVHIHALNMSQDHHTIHLHGLDVDMINDGDPMTSFELSHQEKFTYKFKATHAGTYIYHCHTADVVHVQMGMYGLVIIRPKDNKTAWTGGPAFNKEFSFLMTELDTIWHNNPPKHDPIKMTVKIPKFLPSYFLVNGKSRQMIDSVYGKPNEKIYLRFANIGFYDNQLIFPSELKAQIIDSDGRPLPSVITSDTLLVSPGERYGVMVSSSEELKTFIKINYIDLNAHQIKGVENIPFIINNALGLLKSTAELSFEIYPNPAQNAITVLAPNLENGSLQIVDMLGNTVLDQNASKNNALDIGSIPNGVYFINISSNYRYKPQRLTIVK